MSTSAPVAEIRPDKQINCNVSYFIENEIIDLTKDIKPSSYACGAHTFLLKVGEALKSSIVKVLDGAFTNVTMSSSKIPSNGDGRYKFIFTLDTFNPLLRFSIGFWETSIFASSEIVMKVVVVDANGKEIVRTSIAGEGTANMGGQCRDGSHALSDATQKSIKRVLENFVYKIINSDYLSMSITDKDLIKISLFAN
ncbi:MAG: hypothetical protein JRJ49_07425 [Deltaproteobacteria bacterium]|nr:hypothetical protein [Deltaproteobacteria bacterium]